MVDDLVLTLLLDVKNLLNVEVIQNSQTGVVYVLIACTYFFTSIYLIVMNILCLVYDLAVI